eukprot:CAMPEP_0201989226 /NCGR_PEP_ID=MMETSP0904-20121228/92746_1 /ASSEMBLY_ACC=CAM_ASM_000553 /TAXON_ID=420261 /ORGANISM="Thalassiosira antarctica, Strain CCMP982" /LENGTH=226 /DNA_ID=CAMNT_0048543443 /DNA_START=895 /DNA_END=1575 /DNA_ORIENTATION=-
MCVWENANHQDSKAQLPNIPVVLPHQIQQVSTVVIQPMHSHISTSTTSNNNSNNNSNNQSSNNNSNNQISTQKPTGGFRIRLHWQPSYNWQNNPHEQFYCMECRGSCKSGSSIQIDECSKNNNDNIRQKFIAISKTIRPASNPSLCLTITGYIGRLSPVKLRRCKRGGSSNQNFREVRSNGKFELQPETNTGRCLSQHHHPKPHEVVFPEVCELTRRFDTTYWRTY